MNRGHWKRFSSWKPTRHGGDRTGEGSEKGRAQTGAAATAEVRVKRGYSWSEQIGIAVAALVEDGQAGLVEWVKDVSDAVS